LSVEKEFEKWSMKASSFVKDIRKVEEEHGVKIPVKINIVLSEGKLCPK